MSVSRGQASVTSDADVLEAINVDTYPDGTTVSLEAVFGNTLEFNSTTGDVTSAGAMMQVSSLKCHISQNERANQYQFLVKLNLVVSDKTQRLFSSEERENKNNHPEIQSKEDNMFIFVV